MFEEWRNLPAHPLALHSQIFIVLSYPAYWGEHFLPSSHATALLHYELLHADATLSALSDLLGISSVSTPHMSPNPGSQPTLGPAPPGRSNIFALSPAKTSFISSGSGSHSRGARFIATECISNIRSLITHLKVAIEGGAPGQTQTDMDEVDPEEILRIIEAHLGGVELIESAAMGDLRRGEVGDIELETYFKGLTGTVCGDTLALIPLKNDS